MSQQTFKKRKSQQLLISIAITTVLFFYLNNKKETLVVYMFWLIRDYCARILTSRIKLLHLTGRPCSAPTERKTRGGGLFISMMLGAKMQSKLRINLCFYCCGLDSHDAKNALQKLYEVICSHTTKQPDLNCYCSWRFQLNIQYNPPP